MLHPVLCRGFIVDIETHMTWVCGASAILGNLNCKVLYASQKPPFLISMLLIQCSRGWSNLIWIFYYDIPRLVRIAL